MRPQKRSYLWRIRRRGSRWPPDGRRKVRRVSSSRSPSVPSCRIYASAHVVRPHAGGSRPPSTFRTPHGATGGEDLGVGCSRSRGGPVAWHARARGGGSSQPAAAYYLTRRALIVACTWVGSTNRRAAPQLIAELGRYSKGTTFDGQRMPNLDAEAIDFAAAFPSRLRRSDACAERTSRRCDSWSHIRTGPHGHYDTARRPVRMLRPLQGGRCRDYRPVMTRVPCDDPTVRSRS